MTSLRVAAVQMEHRETVEAALEAATRLTVEAAEGGASIVLLPEYFFAPRVRSGPPPDPAERAERIRDALRDASADAGAAVAGNVVERREGRLLNVLHVYDGGKHVGEQAKVHPMPREAESGIVGGDALTPFPVRDLVAGGIVCADIFYPEVARVLSLQGAELLLNPVMSPFFTPDPTKEARQAVYVARAWDSGAFVLKAGGFARSDAMQVVGRSLITAPWGTLAIHRDEFAEEILYADLDLDALRRFRERHRGFQARAPKAYAPMFDDG